MKAYRFHQLDVFSDQPLRGNPLAVVHGADGVNDTVMAEMARWTNLSETTFLQQPVDPKADYKVRIFTPGRELPFAGHPTLGSCFAWLKNGGEPKHPEFIFQECGIGLVKIRKDGSRLAFAAPALLKAGEIDAATLLQITAALNIKRDEIQLHQWVDNGPGWAVVMLESAEKVLALKPDAARLGDLKLGVIGPYNNGGNIDYEVRAFIPSMGILEDPVTGSLNAGIAKWLIGAGISHSSYLVSQGTALKREGRVFIDKLGDDIWVGGAVTVCIEGIVSF